jgi:flagellar basal-body rod protein FlgC
MIVQQQKLHATAENIANINAYQNNGGVAYKRKSVIIRTMPLNNEPYVSRVLQEPDSVQKVYNPSDPMSDEEGFVSIPDYSLSQEMADMAVSRRMFEANANVFNSAKQLAQTIMNIGK